MPTESHILESELLYRVQQRINDGRLPVARAPSVSAGYAAGSESCAVCDQQLAKGQVSYEVTGPRPLIFHRKCYMAWQRECAQRIAEAERETQKMQPRTRQADPDNGPNSSGQPFKP
jgi:hypothetical protein